ncbi:response regulator [Pseudooceanicola sp. C21-150M6]|uniref:response regulator n=1 Tax=Pseudooceanicola sp. C21-150M6 TaxID=3434355 RepID=UPI003D7F3DD1
MDLAAKLADERRSRLAAERLLEQKQAELHAANRKLGRHARQLSEEIHLTRAQVQTVQDENQRVKLDLSAANEKVQVAERRLWQSIAALQDGFAFFDADGLMLAANDAWMGAFDGLEEVAPGVSYIKLLQLATEEGVVDIGSAAAADWRSMMIDHWVAARSEPFTLKLWNGVSLRMSVHRGHEGDIVCLATDISASVRYERKLQNAQRKAEAANRAKSAFLANMSHEIRTPMHGVVGMSELLSETALTEDQKLYVDTIRNSGEALLAIINDVLDYSKIEAEKLTLSPEPFDLERCIHEVVMLLQPAARDKGLDLVVDYDLFLPTRFIGDPVRIRQVLTNLLGNAVKFTSAGHVVIRVAGLPRPDRNICQIHVSVEDTGIGIAKDQQAIIFGEFNQVEASSSRKFEGSGLGLTITQRLIGLMQGEIWLDSEPDVGSVFGFKIDLPLSDASESEVLPPSLAGPIRNIVLVGTNDVTRAVLEKQLRALGGQVSYCDGGKAALGLIDKSTGLVLTEHHMDGMDGLELTQALRDAGRDVPVIMLSPNVTYAEMDPASRHLSAILQWPAPRRDLFAALADLSGKYVAPVPASADAGIGTDPAAGDRNGIVVLAAEDNATNRLVLTKMLAGLPIDLRFAEDGAQAVAMWTEIHPDLVLMDISMPGVDGLEATRQIRQQEQKRGLGRTPVFAMTAHVVGTVSGDFAEAGMDGHLPKPTRKADLLKLIEGIGHPVAMAPSAKLNAKAI